jgi:Diguanylate cyclase, GGDEF domain
MSEYQPMQRPPRARPVPELPVERLLDRNEELARRWAIALVLSRPLDGLAEVPLEEVAREAPRLCVRFLSAVTSEAEFAALIAELDAPPVTGDPGDGRLLQRISGARGARALVDAVEALRGVLWEALAEQLEPGASGDAEARLGAEACDRLAFVCSWALAVSLAGHEPDDARASNLPLMTRGGRSRTPERATAAAQRVFEAALVDAERRGALAGAERQLAAEGGPGDSHGARPRVLIVDEQAPVAPQATRAPPPSGHPASTPLGRREIEIRDERGEQPRRPWIAAIERELESHGRSARPFGVLVIEIRPPPSRGVRPRQAALAEDVERVLSAELRQAARALSGTQPGSLRAGPSGGSMAREGPSRFWLVAPETDRAEAARLVRRLERALAGLRGEAGTVEVAIGCAVFPDDGAAAAALAEHADIDLYAARSAAAQVGWAKRAERNRPPP